jgi:Protein of unknown function (DUF3592)
MKQELVGFAIFISLFYLAGFTMLGYGLWGALRSTQAAAWPLAEAAITNLDIHEGSNDGSSAFEAKVLYTFRVNGVLHQGSRLAFGYGASSGREAHDEIYQRLKNAKAVSARYNPVDPSVSCLSFGLHRSIQLKLAFAITWLLFVIGFSLLLWLFEGKDSVLLNNLSAQ